jgi:hypothetical protein
VRPRPIAWGGVSTSDAGEGVTGWETSERVLESGVFESCQRVLANEPLVEASASGARTLGVAYWRAIDRFTRGGVRPHWTGEGGALKLLGGATLFTYEPPELEFDEAAVMCRQAIRGSIVTLRTGGTVTLAQRRKGKRYELSVSVAGTLPGRARMGPWAGLLYVAGQTPFHAAVSRHYFDLLVADRVA